MEYLAVFADLKNRPVLVVGGGEVALRKIKILHCTGAIIKIVACTLCSELVNMIHYNNIQWIGKKFQEDMLNEVFLVIVATSDKYLNSLVFKRAEQRYILANVVDDKPKCSFIFPSIINRNPIIVAISSCGKSPVLVRILREKLESLLSKDLGIMAKIAGIWRDRVSKAIIDIKMRRKFWKNMFNGHFAHLISKGKLQEAHDLLEFSINTNCNVYKGNVALVGAGPGNSELLTLRALQLLQEADVILYDYLVDEDILNLARRDAKCICVGKRIFTHSMSQEQINFLLVSLAQQGNRVVRLKGGDPFIFGRGGEEVQYLAKSGIDFQVVPGITAASGAAAYAGIPLTHRDYSHGVIFITGHKCIKNTIINRQILLSKYHTIVIYMSIANINQIYQLLMKYGRDPETPVAIISRATYHDQRVVIGYLKELQCLTKSSLSPALLVIGKVVSLHHITQWFVGSDMYKKFNKFS